MLTKKLVLVVALTVLGLLCPSAYADGDGKGNNGTDPAAVRPQDDTKQKQEGPSVLFPAAGRQAGPTSLLLPGQRNRSTFGPAGSASSPSSSPVGSTDDKWEVIFAPYLYLASINGSMGVGRVNDVPLDVSAGTTLAKLQFGGMGRFEVRKGHWGGIFEASYVELGDSISMTGVVLPVERAVNAEFEQTMLEAFLSYRVGSEKTAVDIFGGARYWDMDLDLDLVGPMGARFLSRGAHWVDPVVGVRVIHSLTDKWFLPARGDVGGFEGGSDFTWNLQGGVGYHMTKKASIVVQYKALSVNYDRGTPNSPGFFKYDAVAHGPLIGFVTRF